MPKQFLNWLSNIYTYPSIGKAYQRVMTNYNISEKRSCKKIQQKVLWVEFIGEELLSMCQEGQCVRRRELFSQCATSRQKVKRSKQLKIFRIFFLNSNWGQNIIALVDWAAAVKLSQTELTTITATNATATKMSDKFNKAHFHTKISNKFCDG